jgi:predicted Holliday junction resolvase-like endonuclease
MKYVFGAIIIILIVLCVYLSVTKSYLASDLTNAQQLNTALTISNKQFVDQVKQANAALEEAQKETIKRTEEANKAVVEAQNQAAQAFLNAQAILAAKPSDKDDCRAAAQFLARYK